MSARRERPRLRTVLIGAFAFGATEVAAAFAPGYTSFTLALLPMGIAFLTFTATQNAFFQLSVDPQLRGRVMSMYMLVFLGMAPIGAPIVGVLADTFGPRVSLALGGVVTVVVTAVVGALLARRLKARVRWARSRPFVSIARDPVGA